MTLTMGMTSILRIRIGMRMRMRLRVMRFKLRHIRIHIHILIHWWSIMIMTTAMMRWVIMSMLRRDMTHFIG